MGDVNSCRNSNIDPNFVVRGLDEQAFEFMKELYIKPANTSKYGVVEIDLNDWHALSQGVAQDCSPGKLFSSPELVTFDDICHVDTAFTTADFRYTLTDGRNLEFDDAAVLSDKSEQTAIYETLKHYKVNTWNGNAVYYSAAFTNLLKAKVDPGYIGAARAFFIATYVAGKPAKDAAGTDSAATPASDTLNPYDLDDGIKVLLGAFAPASVDEKTMTGAMAAYAKAAPNEALFSKFLEAVWHFNKAGEHLALFNDKDATYKQKIIDMDKVNAALKKCEELAGQLIGTAKGSLNIRQQVIVDSFKTRLDLFKGQVAEAKTCKGNTVAEDDGCVECEDKKIANDVHTECLETAASCATEKKALDAATNKCKPCADETVFDAEEKACKPCADGTRFDAESESCVEKKRVRPAPREDKIPDSEPKKDESTGKSSRKFVNPFE